MSAKSPAANAALSVAPKTVKVAKVGNMTQDELVKLIASVVIATKASIETPASQPTTIQPPPNISTPAPSTDNLRPFPAAGQRSKEETAIGREAWTARCEAYKFAMAGKDPKAMSFGDGREAEKTARKAATTASSAVFAKHGFKYVAASK